MSRLFIFFYFLARKWNCFLGIFYFSAEKGKSFYGRRLRAINEHLQWQPRSVHEVVVTLRNALNSCVCVRLDQAANKKQKYERISEKKMSTPVEVLCKVFKCFTYIVPVLGDTTSAEHNYLSFKHSFKHSF